MRITNKMINNNSVYNINLNKEYMDELNTQMSKQKKYVNPSDDPITAIRSLRFRSSLSSITQYLDRNVSDAVSWTDGTQTALDTACKIMESLKAEYTSATNQTKTNADKRTCLLNMQALVKEYFAVGNSTNEDRYIFTGYRTGDSLTFTDNNFDERLVSADDPDKPYQYKGIAEHFSIDDVENYSYTSYKKGGEYYSGITDGDISAVADGNTPPNETDITAYSEYRLRLSYQNIDTTASDTYTYNYPNGAEDAITSYKLTLKTYDSTTGEYTATSTLDVVEITSDSEAKFTGDGDTTVYLNTVTGNLIFTSATQKELAKADDIEFAYDKSDWKIGDVKPEHFFCCTEVGDTKNTPILYNDYLQEMNYTVGSSQSVKVNTNAAEAFTLDAIRDLNELERALDAVDNAQAKYDKLKNMSENTAFYDSEDEQNQIQTLMAAAKKELDYATEKVNTMLSSGITKAQEYFNKMNLASTTCGTTVKRIDVIKNRLTENQATIKSQASENENVDLSTLAVDVTQANLYYSAALKVTGMITQQTLVDFI